jgi:hypothetical protein
MVLGVKATQILIYETPYYASNHFMLAIEICQGARRKGSILFTGLLEEKLAKHTIKLCKMKAINNIKIYHSLIII